MNDQISIRDFRIEDMADVVDILQSISPFYPESSKFEVLATNFLNAKDCYACVVVINGLVVGFGSIFLLNRIRGGIAAVIEDVAIRENERGRGLGSFVVNKLLEYAKNNGCFKVTLVCSEINIPFYQKLNFACDYQSLKILINAS